MIIEAALLILAIVLTLVTIGSIIIMQPAIHRKFIQNRRDDRDREIAELERELGQGG